jgi:SAM-dependent methyltransferase
MMLKNQLKKFYYNIFKNYEKELEKLTLDCKSLLDVGCGNNSPIKHFSNKLYTVGVDAYLPSIEKSKNQRIHNDYLNIDVMDIGEKINSKSFDCVLASDLIEHLTKENGLKLIKMMEEIATKKVIIFTPNGFLPQGEYDNNPWQIHHSGWDVEEMQDLGYKIIGINGWKSLRGEYAIIKFKPIFLWTLLSDITQLYVRNKPKYAFQILCVKELNF